jgi:spore coat polysaccharide biosynthesis protein SpsF
VSRGRVVVVAQARMGSSRLPGKVLERVGGRTVIEHLLARLERAQAVDGVVVATTDHPSDDALVDALEGRAGDVGVARGAVDDVLDRMVRAAAACDAEVVVRVTGDCPFIDPGELDRVLAVFEDDAALDYVTNQAGEIRRIPRGLDVEVMSFEALAEAAARATEPGEREHVTPYLYATPGRYRTLVTDPPGLDAGDLRLTIDTPADLALARAIVAELGDDAETSAIVALLRAREDLRTLNATVRQRGTDSEHQRRASWVRGRRLVARADRSVSGGSGHVARMESLLAAWIELGGSSTLIGAGLDEGWRARLARHGIETEPPGPSIAEDVSRAGRLGASAMIFDGYEFGPDAIGSARAHLPTVAMDDFAGFDHPADLVINQNPGTSSERYLRQSRCGLPFVLLRSEFREALDSPRDARRVVVTLGSSDPAGMTVPITEALMATAPEGARIAVVIGPAAGGDELAAAQARWLADPHVEVHVDPPRLSAVFASAVVAVSAAGTTTWELLACGTIPCVVQVAENQAVVARGLEVESVGLDLGWHETLDPRVLAKRVWELVLDEPRRQALGARGAARVDGRGVWRVIDAIAELVDARDATESARTSSS